MPPSGCTAAGLLQTGRRPAYAARVCKAVHTLAALLRRRSPAPIRSAYAARIRCSSPATAAMAKSRSRLSRCSFTDCAPYDRRRSTAGCAGANFHRKVHQCEHWYSESDACWYYNSRASGGKVVCGSAHAAAREACTKYRLGPLYGRRFLLLTGAAGPLAHYPDGVPVLTTTMHSQTVYSSFRPAPGIRRAP